jgi:putative transposase
MSMPIKTLRVRVKDRHCALLSAMSRDVNLVWNYVNELSARSIRERSGFLSAFDMAFYTRGASRAGLQINSQTVQAITEEYVVRRKQFKKSRLAWRKSGGVRRSLGWVPVKGQTVKFRNGQLVYAGHYFKIWDSYGLSRYKFKSGSFSEDSRGRWYFNIAVEVALESSTGKAAVGIDLGLKTTATASNGDALEAGRFYRDQEPKLAIAQRARNKARVKAIHAKIKNRRQDALHKFSRHLVSEHGLIVVGNVKSNPLTQTRMAKSVLDAGWYMLKTMLEYKCDHAGIVFMEVDERYTTQTCSSCGSRPSSRPKGIAGLGIREWTCDDCGVRHDRDVNAAKNILAVGHGRLAEGIPFQKAD